MKLCLFCLVWLGCCFGRAWDSDKEEACRQVAKIAIEEGVGDGEKYLTENEGIDRDGFWLAAEEEFFGFCLEKILSSETVFFMNGRRPRTDYIGHLVKGLFRTTESIFIIKLNFFSIMHLIKKGFPNPKNLKVGSHEL